MAVWRGHNPSSAGLSGYPCFVGLPSGSAPPDSVPQALVVDVGAGSIRELSLLGLGAEILAILQCMVRGPGEPSFRCSLGVQTLAAGMRAVRVVAEPALLSEGCALQNKYLYRFGLSVPKSWGWLCVLPALLRNSGKSFLSSGVGSSLVFCFLGGWDSSGSVSKI